MRVALATAAEAAARDEDLLPLLAALRRLGIEAEPAVWDDDEIRWDRYDLVVLRSTWDYTFRRDEFLAWTQRVPRLLNPPPVAAWSSDKRYLLQLAAAGVPIVPSRFLAARTEVNLPSDRRFVVKPAVGAGARDAARFGPDDHEQAHRHVEQLLSGGRVVLVQPYLDSVDDVGETALVYFADSFSHALRKDAILGSGVDVVGGLYAREIISPRQSTAAERAVAEQVLDAVPFDRRDLLYARVDLLAGEDGRPVVLEVELVEPSVFLPYADEAAADRFAAAIAARI